MPASPRVVSLFAGAGGLDLGFRQAGFSLVWSNEIDPDAARTYRANLGDHLVQADLAALDPAALPDCDLVIGGPPCQGFSVAGKMDAADPRSRLVHAMIRVIAAKSPAAFVIENVKALARLRRWADARAAIVRELSALGYRVAFQVLRASDFGVPQLRERVFFVGTRCPFVFPPPSTHPPSTRQALVALPRFGEPGNDSLCRAKITPAKAPVLRRSPFAGMLFNGLGRPIDLDRPAPTLPASMGGNKTPIVDQNTLDTGEPQWVLGYHAHLLAGGPPFAEAPSRLRRLTVEECAALQGFPPDFAFTGSRAARLRQIGNAVPPPLARALAEQLTRDVFPTMTR